MKKVKKYLYPFAFSAIFLLLYSAFVLILTKVISFPNGSYAPAALAVLFALAWVMLILPIYCAIYSKIILNEKFKYLFAAYNCLILCVAHILPFNILTEPKILIAFIIWVALWNVLPLVLRLISRKHMDNPARKEDSHLFNSLLQSKKKNIIAICITCAYIISLITDNMVWQFYVLESFLYYTLPLISAVVVLVFLFSQNKEYILKKWMLSFALAGELISGLFSIFSSFSVMDILLKHFPNYPINIIFSCLMNLLIAIMLIGTFFNFKYIKLLKYGTLGHAILSVGLLIFNLINVGGPAYQQIGSNGTFVINTALVIASLLRALYFIGIFILTTNKRNTDSV